MATLLTALSTLKAGVELRKMLKGEEVGIDLKVKQFTVGSNASGGEAVLAFVVLTNESARPRSVTEIIIDFGTVRAVRIPLLGLKAAVVGGDMLDAESHIHAATFDDVEPLFNDLRTLPEDIYLRPHESVSGCALFILPETEEVSKVLVIVDVGGVGRLSVELAVKEA